MPEFLTKITSNFGNTKILTNKDSLVDWDGYDELDKKGAIKYFSRKDRDNVLNHLREGGAYYLEEWCVLNKVALSCCAYAYLKHFIETLDSEEPDEEFVIFFIAQLYQVVYMHKGSPFTSIQTEIIKDLVLYAVQKAKTVKYFEYFSEDISENGQQFFNELSKYSSVVYGTEY